MTEEMTSPTAGLQWSTPPGSGSVADHGAQVLSWQPSGHAPVLWVSEHALFRAGTAIRGGNPICFPWFGSGRPGDLFPAHGFARLATWHRVEAEVSGDVVRVVHQLDQSIATAPSFSQPYRAVATVVADQGLLMELMVENTGTAPFTFEAALHTYLVVGDVTHVSVEGLDGEPFFDQVTGESAVQEGSIVIDREIDRIYDSAASVHVHDPALHRVLSIVKTGSASTIVWNPWVDKARRMQDFGDDEWRGMLCVETANVGARAVTVHPGERHVMAARLTIDGAS